MWVQRKTLILWAIALLLGGLVFSHSFPFTTTEASVLPPLFGFTEAEIIGFVLIIGEQEFVFEQGANFAAQWQMISPESSPASLGAVRSLTAFLMDYQCGKHFPIESNELPKYGLDIPVAEVRVHLSDETTHQLTLGSVNYDETKIYAQIDNRLEVALLPIAFREMVMRELQEWLSPEMMAEVLG